MANTKPLVDTPTAITAAAPIPYGRHVIGNEDIAAVVEVLQSDWLTTGPPVQRFEAAFARRTDSLHAVSFSSGTAALHAMYHAVGIGPGDEVIVPAMTFVATANAALYCGARPVIVDVDPATLLLEPDEVGAAITPRTKAIVAVDYAGQPCDYDALHALAEQHNLVLLADACHSLGGTYQGRSVGTLAAASAFSFHPVKHVTTGEGGMVTTADEVVAERLRIFRNHGISADHQERARAGTWQYDMSVLGFNYRLSGLGAALGSMQLTHLDEWLVTRRRLARRYDAALESIRGVQPLGLATGRDHAYHLYVVRISEQCATTRDAAFQHLRSGRIGANVHYRPVHLHSYYQNHLGTRTGDLPVAEQAGQEILTLPLWPGMEEADVDRVVACLAELMVG